MREVAPGRNDLICLVTGVLRGETRSMARASVPTRFQKAVSEI